MAWGMSDTNLLRDLCSQELLGAVMGKGMEGTAVSDPPTLRRSTTKFHLGPDLKALEPRLAEHLNPATLCTAQNSDV